MDTRQRTLLHTAAYNGDLGVVRGLLCTQGINLDILDKDECTPLCIALRDSHFEMAQVLIEAGADVNLGGGIYGSALHLAVVRANLLLTDMLIKRGAEVNVVDIDGNTPLHFIMNVFSKSESQFKAIAESLVMSGTKPNSKNKELWAPLHIAARKGQIEGIRWARMVNEILGELGMETFDFNLSGGMQKWSILHLSGYSGHFKVVEEILSSGNDNSKVPVNVFARNADHKTARQCTKGNLVLSKTLRKAE
jgi:ankyrin repeat protein